MTAGEHENVNSGDERYFCSFADTPEDIEEAFRVRSEVFTGEQGIPASLVFDGRDGKAVHVTIAFGGEIIGTARIVFPEKKTAKLERMAVLKEHRGTGAGRRLLEFVIDEMIRRKLDRIVLHAQYPVIGFYERCGFRTKGAPFMEAGILHAEMEQTL
jgi:predicted GNAT family N-acyltransferase